jgi:hypothetical protein
VPGVSGVPQFDQRGAPYSRLVGARIDIGAVEAPAADGALSADFDLNGFVEGADADFLAWQRNVGRTAGVTLRHGDATLNSHVDENDLAVWRARREEQRSGSGEQGAEKTDGASIVGVAQRWAADKNEPLTTFRPSRRAAHSARAAIAHTLATTANRRDNDLPPHAATVLDAALAAYAEPAAMRRSPDGNDDPAEAFAAAVEAALDRG